MASNAEDHNIAYDDGIRAAVEDPDAIVSSELATIMPMIALVMAQQAHAGSCSFYIYSTDQTRTVATIRHGEIALTVPDMTSADHISPSDVPIEAEMLRVRRSIRRSTVEDFDRYPMINDHMRNDRPGYADAVVPITRGDHVHGVVYLWRHGDPGAFTDIEIASVERLAEVAAMAVEFARQFGDERTRRQRLNALLNVASLASSHLTVDEVMPAVTRIVTSVTGADVCNLYVFDTDGDQVIDAYSDGLNDYERWVFSNSHQYAASSVPAEERARATLDPVLIRDPERELAPGSELIEYSREKHISEILVAPIVYQRAMIGVIYLWYRDKERTFSDEAISTVRGIANQAGGVVSQARLYDASQAHIAETDALRRIGEAVLNSDSLNSVFDEIREALVRMVPHEYAFVGRIDEFDSQVVVERIWGKFPSSMLHYRFSATESLTGEAFRTGEILNLNDVYHDSRTHRYQPQSLPIQSALIAPLMTENGNVGVLYVAREDTDGFTTRQERFMKLLSQHAAAAIERTEARESLQLHAQQQTFLATVTNLLISADEPDDVLQQICEIGCGVLADGVCIGLSTWQYGDIRWMGGAHRNPELHPVMKRSVLGHEIELDEVRVELMLASETSSLMDLREDGFPVDGRALHPTVTDLLHRVGARQLLSVPMRQPGRAPGLLVLLSSDPAHRLDADLQELAQIVASRIGDALERRQMARNRESLIRVSEAINTHADLDQLVEMFATELHRIVPYHQMYMGKRDTKSGGTTTLRFLNPHGMSVEAVDLAANQGISGEVMSTGKAVLDNQAHQRSSSAYAGDEAARYYAEHGESAMAAPLIAENTVVGVLFIGRSGANRLSEADFETFLLFAGLAASAIHRTELLQNNQLMYRASVEVLAAVVDAKDPTTLEHSRNVARYARIIAEEAHLTASEIEGVELAGLLHDIGKLGIPDHVLSKPGPLTPQERALINTHPERGANILSQHPTLANLVSLVRHHHERVDGSGYPDGLRGDGIPIGASIISIADAFDTMTSQRTYQRKKSISEALEELKRCAGAQFNADLVELFVNSIRKHPDASRPVHVL